MRRSLLCLLVPLMMAAEPTSQPLPDLPDVVDDIVFREALRARGLQSWLDQSLAADPPADEIEVQLRCREGLLAEAGAPGFESGSSRGRNAAAMRKASDVLVQLIADHPSHPGRFRWEYELARDHLERANPSAFANLLLYELPGLDQEIVKGLSLQAVEVLTSLRGRIAQAWTSVEELDEPVLVGVRDSGSLAMLELLDAQSAALLTWARLHQALTADLDPQQRTAAFSQVLNELTDSGRLDLPPGRESEQAGALLMAAVAERHLGLHDQADGRARQIIAVLGRIPDKSVRDRLRQTSLIAVLEQIRAVRDAGRYEAALQALEQARQWAIKSRSDETAALVAVSILETTALYGKQLAGTSIATNAGPANSAKPGEGDVAWFGCAPCLVALERTSQQSAAHRDLLYSVLAPALASQALAEPLDSFALQLLAGSAVVAARKDPANLPRLESILTAVRQLIASSRATDLGQGGGELRYLLGQGLVLAAANLEAVQFLTDLAEQNPAHDRAEAAIRQAVTLASHELRRAGSSGLPASRSAFVRAARVMRERLPTHPSTPELTYATAAALENDARYEEAADEYALVPPAHGRSLDAALGRIGCWRRVLEQAAADHPLDTARVSAFADRARSAVRAVREQFPAIAAHAPAATAPAAGRPELSPNDCDQAQLLLAMAELLNHPALGSSQEAVDMTSRLEQAACPELHGPALRQQILALRQMKRLTEARAVVERYLTADPDHAGTAMAGLLQSMHEEATALRQRGEDSAAAGVAVEAVQVGESLLAWAAERPGRLRPGDRLIIRFWHASALLHAGRAADALNTFEQIEQDGKGVLPGDSATLAEVRLGKADAMLESRQAHEALAAYDSLLQLSPEHSDAWWHALVGSLKCHVLLDSDPAGVLQAIRQQRFLAPDLGGGQWHRALTELEQTLLARTDSRPHP